VANHYEASHYSAHHYAANHYHGAAVVAPTGPQGFGGAGASSLTGLRIPTHSPPPELVPADIDWIDIFGDPSPPPAPKPRLRTRPKKPTAPRPQRPQRPHAPAGDVVAAVTEWAKSYLAWEMVAKWRGDPLSSAPRPPSPTDTHPWSPRQLDGAAAALEAIHQRTPREIFAAHTLLWRNLARRIRLRPVAGIINNVAGEVALGVGAWYARRWFKRSCTALLKRFGLS